MLCDYDFSPPPTATTAAPTFDCSAGLLRTPYLPDLGGAGAGRVWNWVVVKTTTHDWFDLAGGWVDCSESTFALTVSMEGAAAVPISDTSTGPVHQAVVAVATPAAGRPATLTIGLTATCPALREPAPDGATTATATFAGTYSLRLT